MKQNEGTKLVKENLADQSNNPSIFLMVISALMISLITTRKLINTNGNTKGIFSSVNFRGILPTEIFPWYIPRELPWEKN
jgi:hypothetical protein